jgi:hypothetical protein
MITLYRIQYKTQTAGIHAQKKHAVVATRRGEAHAKAILMSHHNIQLEDIFQIDAFAQTNDLYTEFDHV